MEETTGATADTVRRSEPGGSAKESFVGNVSKYTPAPTGCEDPTGKGFLQFDACYEGGEKLLLLSNTFYQTNFSTAGNLGRVDCINDFEYDLFIRPDTCNPK